MKTKARFLVIAAFCLACLAALVGCASNNEQTDAQTQNRQYMSSVNTIMETLNTNMGAFSEAVKDGEVVSLSAQLSAVDQCVSDLEGLSVPDAMGDIHSSYVNGAKELQTALSSYVQLYEDVKAPANGVAPSGADYDSRMAEIQSHYDAKNVELLAHAGNMECLHAAVKAGADAAYLGAGHFNARRGADNFSLENLAEACDYAHLRGVKIYLTLNTVVLPSELPDALELARQAYRCGVDAFIVQDIGISIELSRIMPDVEVHVSTQMNIHDEDGLRAAAALGATRVTLARELSLAEIARLHELAEELGVELESFAHGALCICYSGQCFMSSLVGGRSANRGRCAQACRLPYELHNRALRKTLDAPGEHLLSPKDLCTANLIPELLQAGVASLKIEGRMKSPEYVQAVVGVYRAVIDRVEAAIDRDGINSVVASDAPELRASEEEMNVLSEAFSRGFTTAYLKGKRGNEIMSYGRPNNRGVFVGRVAKVREGLVFIDPETELHVGDLIEFWTNRGHFVHTIGEFKTDRAGRVFFPVERAVGKGDRVFRVRNAEAAFVDDDKLPSVAVCARAELRIGQPALLTFTVASGDASVTVEGPEVEAARTKAITEEEVREHIDRMGTTPFYLSSLEIDLDEGVGMGFSMLHKLRARAAEELQETILAHYHARKLERTPSRAFAPVVRKGWCKVAALATNPACARAAKRAGADLIYVPAANYRRGSAFRYCRASWISQTMHSGIAHRFADVR